MAEPQRTHTTRTVGFPFSWFELFQKIQKVNAWLRSRNRLVLHTGTAVHTVACEIEGVRRVYTVVVPVQVGLVDVENVFVHHNNHGVYVCALYVCATYSAPRR